MTRKLREPTYVLELTELEARWLLDYLNKRFDPTLDDNSDPICTIADKLMWLPEVEATWAAIADKLTWQRR